MKKLIYLFMVSTTFVCISSCSSDPCEDVSCFNGGICVEGTCDCPSGWAGADCSTFDFLYAGEYASTSFTSSGCMTASNNGTITANADDEYCLVNSDDNTQCVRFLLVLEADNSARFVRIDTEIIGSLRIGDPTTFRGNYTTNNERITFVADDNAGTIVFTVKEDRSGLEWEQSSSGTDGCTVVHDLDRR